MGLPRPCALALAAAWSCAHPPGAPRDATVQDAAGPTAPAGAQDPPAGSDGGSPPTAAPPATAAAKGALSDAAAAGAAGGSADAGAPEVGAARGALGSAARALAAFRAAWKDEVRPAAAAKGVDLARYDEDVRTRAHATRKACREGHARVKDTLGAGEASHILFSRAAAIDRPGQCWEVRVEAGRWNEILGYLDPSTGALLFVWLVPEG